MTTRMTTRIPIDGVVAALEAEGYDRADIHAAIDMLDTGHVDGLDREAIDAIRDQLGGEPVDADALWDIIARRYSHPAEQFRDELAVAIAAAPAGTPATWTGENATVTVVGASRAWLGWPQPVAEITITTPDGTTTKVDGGEVESWGALWSRVQDAVQQWEMTVDAPTRAAVQLQRKIGQLERQLSQLRARRDEQLRAARRAGVTAYRLAKLTGLAERSVGQILQQRV